MSKSDRKRKRQTGSFMCSYKDYFVKPLEEIVYTLSEDKKRERARERERDRDIGRETKREEK